MIDGMADGVTQDSQFHAKRVGASLADAYALSMGSVLDDGQIEQYHRDGFLVIEGFVDAAACNDLKAAANRIVSDFQPTGAQTIFTTSEQERVSNSEFLASGSGVWCFFEEEAFDDAGRLRTAKELSINKIGHAMHDLDPAFEKFSYRPELAGVAADIGMADALALQSMYIFKQPLIGGEVACHQDSTFLYTDPLTVAGFWFAIEDSTLDNGCLWTKPGSHRTGLRKVFKRAGETDDDGTYFDTLDPAPLPSPSELTPLPVPAGTMVILHGLLPHWSDINRSPASRHAYSLHCISAAAEYPEWNWLRRPADMPLRSLAEVAGVAA
jgi:phytanoyl-CoA hydroxylase